MNQSRNVRWGVLGTARIAAKVTRAIHAVDGAEVVAVASRSGERAASWAKDHGVPYSYGTYQALLDDDQLDAIYVPLPPSMHAEWTMRCAEAGKHVLCEKPLAINAVEAESMATACRKSNVQLMDATMWVHHPRAAEMLRSIGDGQLGALRRMTVGFGMNMETYIQQNPPHMAQDNQTGNSTLENCLANELRMKRDMGGGCLLDLGWYCIRAALWAFGGLPRQVYGTARYHNDVDINFSGLMWFENDRMSSFDCGFDLTWRKWFEVVGTGGSLVCDDFVNPWDSDRPRYWIHNQKGSATEFATEPLIQEQCMIDHFCQIVRTGELNDAWPKISIANQRICDALDQSARSGKVVQID